MTKPEKTVKEFYDEGIYCEKAEYQIFCPFCYYEYLDDHRKDGDELTCTQCDSIMSLEAREIIEYTTIPLVDKRNKSTTEREFP